jgi:plasmid stabilization system protein ParE
MKYEVIWAPAAVDQLAELWTSSVDRNAVAAAADEIEGLLRSSARSAGESREGNERIVFAPPLVAFVDIDAVGLRAIVRRLRRSSAV